MNNNIKVKIEGKNVNNYIKWLIINKINIYKLNIIKHNILEIIIDYKDYKKLLKYSKTYRIRIVKKYGKLDLKDKIINNAFTITSIIISIIMIYILSNVIFSVDIIYNDKEIINKLNKELEKYNIKKYHWKKNFNYLNKIKKQILDDNKDIFEWIEIEEHGTKYIVRIVERKKEIKVKSYQYQSIVAKKDAIIISIKANSGEKVKTVNEYVKKGQIIINGTIVKSNDEITYCKADGIVYGEVWYKISIEYPLYYKEEKITGKKKNVLAIRILEKDIPLFKFKEYKQFKLKSIVLLKENFVPIELVKEKLYEVNIKERIYTKEEAIKKAIDESKTQLLKKNNSIKEIKEVLITSERNLNSKIELKLFVSVIEDITKVEEIIPETLEKTN